ncbi:MAG: hypothetical protein PHC90_01995 [Syntrophorhabdaceae bacterium]|nr:hypothetical protein [Syntrophorhabdaceae bacterium]
MTIFIYTLTGLAVVVLVVYLAIPIAQLIKNKGKRCDVAEVMYPGDAERQSGYRDKVASEILRNNPGFTYESPEFQVLYRQEMDRLLKEYQSQIVVPRRG